MYRWRLGEDVAGTKITELRGLEGARMRETYKHIARQYGVTWTGRRYDRHNPDATNMANMAINHAAQRCRRRR